MYCNISVWKCTGLKKPVPFQKNLYQFKKTCTGTNPNCTKGQIELQHVHIHHVYALLQINAIQSMPMCTFSWIYSMHNCRHNPCKLKDSVYTCIICVHSPKCNPCNALVCTYLVCMHNCRSNPCNADVYQDTMCMHNTTTSAIHTMPVCTHTLYVCTSMNAILQVLMCRHTWCVCTIADTIHAM